ncbi:FMN-binding negative transcriptional regulator [Spongiactinospora sp. 9N601]|uniref:FMN-binding negative transcriptional regulator n=1 Tax=Spongiactinospora sp. 9N601 TaxID=3375149 RepID=UPI003793864A
MLEVPIFALDDPAEIRALIADQGWALLVSDGGPVVSHAPVIPDPATAGPEIVGHLARTDAELHELGERRIAVVVQGPHGYISPTLYQATPYVPTWNYVTVHLYGTPEILDPRETYQVLSDSVDHYERDRAEPFRLASAEEYAHRLLPAVTGFRLVPDRVVGKAKLSQDKPAEIAERVIAGLTDPVLATAMRRAHQRP